MNLHASSSTFRQIFKSQQTTQLFVDAYKAYVSKITALPALNSKTTSTVEKLNHLGLAFALDNSVAGSQKRQVRGMLGSVAMFFSLIADFRYDANG